MKKEINYIIYSFFIYILLSHVFMYKLVKPNHDIFGTDVQVQSQTFNEAIKKAVEKGEFPWWTNDILGGMPTQASFFTNKQKIDKFYYVLTYPIFAPINLIKKTLNLSDTYPWVMWFTLFATFMFIYLRHLGVSFFGAFVGGLSFMSITGFVSLFYPGHLGKALVIGFMPLILFFLDLGFNRKRPLFYFLCSGFFLTYTMSWHIQIFFILCVFLLLYLTTRIALDLYEKRSLKRAIILSVLTGCVFLMPVVLTADQLLPRFEFKKYTHRGSLTQVSEMDKAAIPGEDLDLEKYYFVTSFSQPPEDLLGLFMRYPFGMGKPYGGLLKEVELPYYRGRYELRLSLEYVGIFVFILAILGAIKYIRQREVKIIVVLGILSILLSLGKYTFLFDILYKMPGFKNFRIPLVYIMVSYFSFAALAGFGANYIEDFIKKRENGFLKGFLIGLSSITIILFAIALLGSLFERESIEFLLSFELVREMLWGIYQDVFQRYAIFLYNLYYLVGALILICLFIYLTIRNIMSVKIAYLLIPLAISLDLWTLNNKFIIVIPKQENIEQYMSEDELVKFLKADKSYFRIKSNVDEVNNRWVLFGISNVEGYHPTPLKHFEDLYSQMNFTNNIDNLLNIKYLILFPDDQLIPLIEGNQFLKNKYKKVAETTMYSVVGKTKKPVFIYKNEHDYGRFFFVYNAALVDDERALVLLASPNFNPKETALLAEKPTLTMSFKKGNYEKIDVVKYSPNEVILNVENDGSGILVFSENWYPAWKAYLDGQKTQIYRTYVALRSIFVPQGKHTIRFVYESSTLFFGNVIFLVSFIVLIVVFLNEMYFIFIKKES